jgi:hypothetical protein
MEIWQPVNGQDVDETVDINFNFRKEIREHR